MIQIFIMASLSFCVFIIVLWNLSIMSDIKALHMNLDNKYNQLNERIDFAIGRIEHQRTEVAQNTKALDRVAQDFDERYRTLNSLQASHERDHRDADAQNNIRTGRVEYEIQRLDDNDTKAFKRLALLGEYLNIELQKENAKYKLKGKKS